MKRDMGLVRQIAFLVEEVHGDLDSSAINIDGFTPSEVAYHCTLMVDANLIKTINCSTLDSDDEQYSIQRLTDAGHDFVEAARNETVWTKVVGTLKEKAIGGSIEIMVKLLKSETMRMLGMSGE